MLKGIGIEIVDVGRFKAAMERWGERLLKRLFTENELAYCLGRRRAAEHLAARFAAKESLVKALGRRLRFKDMEVMRGEGGSPAFHVTGVKGLAKGERAVLTMSHDGGFAVAETVVTDEVVR